MPTVRVEYYGVEGEGRNVTEARADAGRKIAKAIRGSYDPYYLHLGRESAIVYRTPLYGWSYALLDNRESGTVFGTTMGEPFEETLQSARKHLAQLAWDGCNDQECLDFVEKSDRGEFQRWLDFQNAYKVARAEGLSDTDAFAKAAGPRYRG